MGGVAVDCELVVTRLKKGEPGARSPAEAKPRPRRKAGAERGAAVNHFYEVFKILVGRASGMSVWTRLPWSSRCCRYSLPCACAVARFLLFP